MSLGYQYVEWCVSRSIVSLEFEYCWSVVLKLTITLGFEIKRWFSIDFILELPIASRNRSWPASGFILIYCVAESS